MEEALYYNVLAIALENNYKKLRALKTTNGSWTKSYAKLQKENVLNNLKPEAEWQKLETSGVELILSDDINFPSSLREIPFPSFGIYVRGTLPQENQLKIAIVGTRKATPTGKLTAHNFAEELARTGVVVVSGLAFGIDAAAHNGSLDAGGTTLAVLAHGLDEIYPRTHTQLGEKIIQNGGALISEYPLGSPSFPYRFLERNRIVSGLSQGVVVLEAPITSGSLATARFALEQNRDVFVVPGPVNHPNFVGSHALIRQGAELVTGTQEILESLGVTPLKKAEQTRLFSTPEEKIILDALVRGGPLHVDKIIEVTNLKATLVNQALSLLLLSNIIQETEEGYQESK